ncbi:MAG: hypothetical protein SNJ49_15315, partial [Chloracidobacterium sp.]
DDWELAKLGRGESLDEILKSEPAEEETSQTLVRNGKVVGNGVSRPKGRSIKAKLMQDQAQDLTLFQNSSLTHRLYEAILNQGAPTNTPSTIDLDAIAEQPTN